MSVIRVIRPRRAARGSRSVSRDWLVLTDLGIYKAQVEVSGSHGVAIYSPNGTKLHEVPLVRQAIDWIVAHVRSVGTRSTNG